VSRTDVHSIVAPEFGDRRVYAAARSRALELTVFALAAQQALQAALLATEAAVMKSRRSRYALIAKDDDTLLRHVRRMVEPVCDTCEIPRLILSRLMEMAGMGDTPAFVRLALNPNDTIKIGSGAVRNMLWLATTGVEQQPLPKRRERRGLFR
jgi:hypothetical protein